jgi:hypothetical protein
MSAKAKVDELLAKESHHGREQMFHQIRAEIEVQLYRAGKVTTSERRPYQVRLNTARHVATIWADGDQQSVIT